MFGMLVRWNLRPCIFHSPSASKSHWWLRAAGIVDALPESGTDAPITIGTWPQMRRDKSRIRVREETSGDATGGPSGLRPQPSAQCCSALASVCGLICSRQEETNCFFVGFMHRSATPATTSLRALYVQLALSAGGECIGHYPVASKMESGRSESRARIPCECGDAMWEQINLMQERIPERDWAICCTFS